ncbi:MAG: response regulator [Actinobacteria bacterium]|nr:response regulator [Actinomycetota bacterium]
MENRVLYVEDDQANRSLMVTIFERYFPQVTLTVATNGSEALVAFDGEPPRLVLVDGYLGDMTGPELIELLRARAPLPPVVVVSGSLPPDSAVGIEGVVEHVMKPFKIADLVALVAVLLDEAPAR